MNDGNDNHNNTITRLLNRLAVCRSSFPRSRVARKCDCDEESPGVGFNFRTTHDDDTGSYKSWTHVRFTMCRRGGEFL